MMSMEMKNSEKQNV